MPIKVPEKPAIRCVFDFNTALGTTLGDKVDSLFVVMVRVDFILRWKYQHAMQVLVVSPLVLAILEVTGRFKGKDNWYTNHHEPTASVGRAFDRWDVLVDFETYDEHHIYMAFAADSGDPEMWAKISLLNFLMDNKFGHYNLNLE